MFADLEFEEFMDNYAFYPIVWCYFFSYHDRIYSYHIVSLLIIFFSDNDALPGDTN